MRVMETNVYEFTELSETGKEKALENLNDINVNYDWWDCLYEDADNIGLKITSFDLDRNRHATGNFTRDVLGVAENIIREHGDTCETYKTAEAFLAEHATPYAEYLDETSEHYLDEPSEHYESKNKEDELIEIENDFLKDILEDYSVMLQKTYEYLCSDEAIIETIEANGYEFTEDGVLI